MYRLIFYLTKLYRKAQNLCLTYFGSLIATAILSKMTNNKVKIVSRGIPQIHIAKTSNVLIGNQLILNNGERFNPIGRQSKTIIVVKDKARLSIGNNVGISSSCIYCSHEISIGNNVKIGGNTCIYDTDFHSLNYNDRRNGKLDKINIKKESVNIGDDVFIGAHSTILKGVKIGNRSIIGAQSLVSKSIPDGEIWAGNPIKFIKKVELYNED